MAIVSFSDKNAQDFFETERIAKGIGWGQVKNIVKRKLDLMQYAAELDDLKSPPGNRLEALKGDLQGFHSIRVNDQWRVVFRWTPAGASEVKVIDYH